MPGTDVVMCDVNESLLAKKDCHNRPGVLEIMTKPTFLTYKRPLLTCMVQAYEPDAVKELIDASVSEGAEAFGMQFCRLKTEYRNKETYKELFAYTDLPVYVTNYRNHGSNAGINVLYSGTMGAAIEGSFYHCPAIGLSLTDHSPDADFTAAKHYAHKIIQAVLENPIEQGSTLCLNVNVPDIDPMDIKGIKVCRQCRGIWREEFYPHLNPQGRRYFWLAGAFDNYEPDCEQTDEWALANGYVAVVPVQIDMTAYDRLPYLERVLK